MTQIGRVRDATFALTGGDDTVLAANGNRQFLLIHNPTGNASVGLNLVGLDSSAAPGTVDLPAGTTLIFDHWVMQNEIHAKGTSTQKLVILEG